MGCLGYGNRQKHVAPNGHYKKGVNSDQSTRVKYGGKTLQSRDECWWQVRAWDKNGEVTDWSEPAFWRNGRWLELGATCLNHNRWMKFRLQIL